VGLIPFGGNRKRPSLRFGGSSNAAAAIGGHRMGDHPSAPIPTTLLSDNPFQAVHRNRAAKALEAAVEFVT
jgi:hypothetical protein